ncbi:unnamed protein product [Rotaria sp. Silwood2]|nr:unnamed protein product [Rotaria sp. Silwood2]
MNLFIIIFTLILFHGNYIYGLETGELDGIDVLTVFKNKAGTCKLRNFVRSETDFTLLTDDLNKYCSSSDSVKQYRILCHMISYELEKACALPPDLRPAKPKYATNDSSAQICSMLNLNATNEWIWNRITNNGQKQIGVDSKNLCAKITADTDTLRLARFFYKIAPRVRNADSSQQGEGKFQSNTNNKVLTELPSGGIKNTKEAAVDAVQTDKEKTQLSADNNTKKTDETVNGLKEKTVQTGEGTKDKTGQAAEEPKDKAGEGTKEKTVQTGEGTKDKTGQAAEKQKDKASEDTKDKANEGTKSQKCSVEMRHSFYLYPNYRFKNMFSCFLLT